MNKNSTTRIALWSGPRNVSTALMYAFAQRRDTQVLDEPLFAYFLEQTGVERPSREEALKVMESNPEKIIREQLMAPVDNDVLFIKNMANHLEGLDWDFLQNFKNVILTRHPAEVIASYTKQVDRPTLLDLCYEHQVQLLDYLEKHKRPLAVIDSTDIRKDPDKELRKLCDFAGIPFDKSMLSWKPGPRPEDGVWAKYWYYRLHQSTGFAPYQLSERAIRVDLQPLLEQCLPLYNQLIESKHRL